MGPVFLANLQNAVIYCYIAKVVLQSKQRQKYCADRNDVSGSGHHNSQTRMRQAKGAMATFLLLACFIFLWAPVLILHGIKISGLISHDETAGYSKPTAIDEMDA